MNNLNLNFKQGLFKELYDENKVLNSNISNGTIGFAKFDDGTNGSLVIKLENDTPYNVMPPPGEYDGAPLVSSGINLSPKYTTVLSTHFGGTGLSHINKTLIPNRLYFFGPDANDNSIPAHSMTSISGHINESSLVIGYEDKIDPVWGFGIRSGTIDTPYLMVSSEGMDDNGLYPYATFMYYGDYDSWIEVPRKDGTMVVTAQRPIKPSNYAAKYNVAFIDSSGGIEPAHSFQCEIYNDKSPADNKYYGYNKLILGNSSEPSSLSTTNMRGIIRLYADNYYYTEIQTRDKLNNKTIFYLPECNPGYALWSSSADTAIGSSSVPVYIKNTGEVAACAASDLFSSLTWTNGTTAGPTLNATIAGRALTATIPSASTTQSGIVTTGQQSFIGTKTFEGWVYTGHLIPKSRGISLGNSTNPWSTVYGGSNWYFYGNDKKGETSSLVLGGQILIGESTEELNGSYSRFYLGNADNVEQYNPTTWPTSKPSFSLYTMDGNTKELIEFKPESWPTEKVDNLYRIASTSRHGELWIRSKYTGNAIVRARTLSAKNTVFYLPDTKNGDPAYAVWTLRSNTATGNSTQPIYINEAGQVVVCSGNVITSGEQTFQGNKTFTNNLSANTLTLSSTNSETHLGFSRLGHNYIRFPYGTDGSGSIVFESKQNGILKGVPLQIFYNKLIPGSKTIDSKSVSYSLGDEQNTWDYIYNNTFVTKEIQLKQGTVEIGNLKYIAASESDPSKVQLTLGNKLTEDNRSEGVLQLYRGKGRTNLRTIYNTANDSEYNIYLPDSSGQLLYKAKDGSSVGDNSTPVYIDGTGKVNACTTANLKAGKDASGNVITSTYETQANAKEKLKEAKDYANQLKVEILGSEDLAETYDTLKEIGDWINTHENVTVVNLTEMIAKEEEARIKKDDEFSTLINNTQFSASNGISVSESSLGKTIAITGVDASNTVPGIVSTGAQTFAGTKTFNNSMIVKNTLTIQDKNNYQGGKFYTTDSTSTVSQATYLELGNSTATGSAGSRYGVLKLYGTKSLLVNIRARETATYTNSTFYIPQGASSSDSCYGVWASDTSAVGSSTTPVYVDANGQIQACGSYSSLFTRLTSSFNTLSLTIGGTPKTASIINSVSNNWTGGTTNGPTLTTTINGVNGTAVTIPSASKTTSGVVTTDKQTFAGEKTFSDPIIFNTETQSKRIIYGSSRNSGMKYDYNGKECLMFSSGSYGSSTIQFYAGNSIALNDTPGQFNADTSIPAVHIFKNGMAINYNIPDPDSMPSNFYVNGSSKFDGAIIGVEDKNYGDELPTTATVGQIYFKLI